MSTCLKLIGRMTQLALAFAALALLGAAGSGAQAPKPKPEVTPAVQMARHFQHEDALYAAKPVTGQTRTPAQAMALHFQHEDALYRVRDEIRQTRTPVAGSASAASITTPQALRALTLRGQALNTLYGNAWTRVSSAEFKTLVAAFGGDVTTTMTLQQAHAELARGQGLNRLAKQYTTASEPVSAVSDNGFKWGDAGIGVAAAFGAMLLAAAGAIGLRKRGRLVLHS
jgi:hypothetical protein